MNTTCNICCDNYNKSNRFKICCPYCDFDICRTCCETYILSETTAKCMKPECGKEWSRKFLRENLTNTFLNSKFKTHLENILFDQEKALMPATQPLVEAKIVKRNIKKQIKDLNLLIDDLVKQRKVLEQQLHSGIMDTPPERVQFVRQCPANGCRGFLSTQWKCGICEMWTCPQCHEVKGTERDGGHICDPNNVETAKLLAKDSKPCPKCQSMIFKIEGCDQMWCTQCHTAFSWRTGKLETNIHNPHYYEWQRKNGSGNAPRNAGDIECGRELNQYTMQRIRDICKNKHTDLCIIQTREYTSYTGHPRVETKVQYIGPLLRIQQLIRNVIHNNLEELPNFQTDYILRNQDLRIKYLENELLEDEFKMLIQRNDKKNKKNNEIAQVLQLSNIAVTDIIYRLIDHLNQSESGKHTIDLFIGEIDEIIKYCNDIFKDISFTYCTVQYAFSQEFEFKRVEKEKKNKTKPIMIELGFESD